MLCSYVSVERWSVHVVGFEACVGGFLWCACGAMLLEAEMRLWDVAFGMEPVG